MPIHSVLHKAHAQALGGVQQEAGRLAGTMGAVKQDECLLQISQAVTVADEAKSYIALDKAEAREGENVTITLTDEAKKVLFIKVIKEDGSVEYIRNSATSFTMPAGAVTVSVIAPDNWFEEGRYDFFEL